MNSKAFAAFAVSLLLVAGLLVVVSAIAPSQTGDSDTFDVSDDVSLGAIPPNALPIYTQQDLARVGTGQTFLGQTWSLSAYYYLENDITLTGTNNHTPIGTDSAPFTGTFDGNGHTIYGMNPSIYKNSTLQNHSAMFSYIENATITNLRLDNISVYSGGYTAGIATYSLGGKITNCMVSGTIYSDGSQSTAWAGGILASSPWINPSTIINCSFTGTVTASDTNGSSSAGGIVGSGRAIITNCNNSGSISSNIIVNNSETGNTTLAGGIIGGPGAIISNCYNAGSISASVQGTGTGLAQAGGISGNYSGSSIEFCYNNGTVSSTSITAAESGGIVGRLSESIVSNCYNTASIYSNSSNGNAYSGGIAGTQTSGNITSSIENCYNVGWIYSQSSNGNSCSGGISGYMYEYYANSNSAVLIITNCYNVGWIYSQSPTGANLGGILGSTNAPTTIITNVYFLTGTLQLNGSPHSDAIYTGLTNPVIDGNISGIPRPGAQGSGAKTVTDMQPLLSDAQAGNSIYYTGSTTVGSFATFDGWDFNTIWTIAAGSAYPQLSAFIVDIISTPTNQVITGDTWSYTPVASSSSASISVSAPSWLNFNGITISGVAPAPANGISQTYTITVTADLMGLTPAVQIITLTVYNPVIQITSTPIDQAQEGITWSYTPQINTTGYTLSVTGISWLNAYGNTISGTAPAPSDGISETFTATLTVSKSGWVSATQTITITVTPQSVSPNAPQAALTVTQISGWTFLVDASASTDFVTLSIDLGDGNTSSGVASITHPYLSAGAYTVTVTASATGFSPSIVSMTVVAFNETVIDTAIIGNQYRYVLPFTLGGLTPVLSQGPLWLSIESYGHDDVSGRDYVIVSGNVPVTAVPGSTVNVSATAGANAESWTITLESGPNYPVAGFIASTFGLMVTIVPSTLNVTTVWYDLGDGTIRNDLNPNQTFIHTYAQAGTYTITQNAIRQEGGTSYPPVIAQHTVTVNDLPSPPQNDPVNDDGLDSITIIAAVIMIIIGLIIARFAPGVFKLIGIALTLIAIAIIALLLTGGIK